VAKKSYGARATEYARGVVSGKYPAGQLLRAACQRHLDDLERSKSDEFPYAFNPRGKAGKLPPAESICQFAENMLHVKGEWAGKTIVLEDWQCFLFAVAFGWVRKSGGMRRFRELYWEICRKNAKSTMGAIIGLYMTFVDGEAGADVLAGATSEVQAYFVFKPAWLMVKKNPEFAQRFEIRLSGTENNPGNIYSEKSGSSFRVIIGKPGDGDNPHCAIIDEYHEHSSSDQYDAMKTGMGARRQPLRAIITTAGTDTSGPCYDKHLEAKQVLEGAIENEEFFPVVYGIDAEDDYRDFEVWRKANPNMGVSVKEDYLRGLQRDAIQKPSETNAILTKNLNKWMSSGVAWMNMMKWAACARPTLTLEAMRKKRCWLGLDLASKIDIADLAYLFELEPGLFALFARHYLPSETIELPHNAHYRKWRDQGLIIETDGARTDFIRIEADIRDAQSQFAVQSLSFDPREANYLISNVQEWASFDCVEITQGPQQMSEPMKEMEGHVYSQKLLHPDDPVLNWMMGNVVKKLGRTGGAVKYYYPTKERDANKIDGIVAGIMALSRAMLFKEKFARYSPIRYI
jgi:phage terminase large subunit-like protein